MSTNTSASANVSTYAIECQKCGHAWLAAVEAIRARGRSAMRCPVCEPLDVRALAALVAASSAPAPTRLSPELSGKTWVITRSRRTGV